MQQALNILKVTAERKGNKLFFCSSCETKSNTLKLEQKQIQEELCRKNAPITKIIKDEDRLHIEAGEAYSLEVF